MKLFVLFFFHIFVHIESSKRRAVNLALETVIEFNNKDRITDLKFIDDVQNFLGKIKNVLGGKRKPNQNHRRALQDLEMTFIEFLEQAIEIIKSYDDDDMREFCNTFEKELRNIHYEGCKIPELLERSDLRRFIGDVLQELKHISAQKVRAALDNMLKTLQEKKVDKKNKEIIDFFNSLHEMEGPNLTAILRDLEGYKSKSKRADMDLQKIIRHGLRSTLFDHYSKLNPNLRREFKLKLEAFKFDPLTNAVHHRIYNLVDKTTTLPPILPTEVAVNFESKKLRSEEESSSSDEEDQKLEKTDVSKNMLRIKPWQTMSSHKFKPYVSLVTEKFTDETKISEKSIEDSDEHSKTAMSTMSSTGKTTYEIETQPSFYTNMYKDRDTGGFIGNQEPDKLTSQPAIQTIYEESWTEPKKLKSKKHKNKKHHTKKDKKYRNVVLEHERYKDELNYKNKNKHKLRMKDKKHNLREKDKKHSLKQKYSSKLPSLVTLYEEAYTWHPPKKSKHHKKHHQRKTNKKKHEKHHRAEIYRHDTSAYDDASEHETLEHYRTTSRDVTTARFKTHTEEQSAEDSSKSATNSKETNEVSENKDDVEAENKKLERIIKYYENIAARERPGANTEDNTSEEIVRNKPKIRDELTPKRSFISNEGLSIESFEQTHNNRHRKKETYRSYDNDAKHNNKHHKTVKAKNYIKMYKEKDAKHSISSGKGNLRFLTDDIMDDVINNNVTVDPKIEDMNFRKDTTGNYTQSTKTAKHRSEKTVEGKAVAEKTKERSVETMTTKFDSTISTTLIESTSSSEPINKDFDYRVTDDPHDLLPLRTVNKTLLSDVINYKNKLSIPFRSEPSNQMDIPFIEMVANDTLFASKINTTTNRTIEEITQNTMNDLKNIREILFTTKNDTKSTTELNLSEVLKESKDDTEDGRRRNMIHPRKPLDEDLESYKEFIDEIGDDLI